MSLNNQMIIQLYVHGRRARKKRLGFAHSFKNLELMNSEIKYYECGQSVMDFGVVKAMAI